MLDNWDGDSERFDDSGRDALSEDGVNNNSELEDERLSEVEKERRNDICVVFNEFALYVVTETPGSEDVRLVVVLLLVAEDITDEVRYERLEEDGSGLQRPYPF
jgi:hypothetical protein